MLMVFEVRIMLSRLWLFLYLMVGWKLGCLLRFISILWMFGGLMLVVSGKFNSFLVEMFL